MEGENRLLGDPAARSRSHLAEVEEAGRKTCLGERRGKAPRPPLNAASAAMHLPCWLTCALLMQSRRRRGIPARRPIRSALSDSDAKVSSLDRPVQPAAAVHAEQGSTALRHGRWFRPWRITEPVGPPARRLPGYLSPNNSERSFLRTVASRSKRSISAPTAAASAASGASRPSVRNASFTRCSASGEMVPFRRSCPSSARN